MKEILKRIKQNIIMYFKCLRFILPRAVLLYLCACIVVVLVTIVYSLTLFNKALCVASVLLSAFLLINLVKFVVEDYTRRCKYSSIAIYTLTEINGEIPQKLKQTGWAITAPLRLVEVGIFVIIRRILKYLFKKPFCKSNPEKIAFMKADIKRVVILYLWAHFCDAVPFIGKCCVAGRFLYPEEDIIPSFKANLKRIKSSLKKILPKWLIWMFISGISMVFSFMLLYIYYLIEIQDYIDFITVHTSLFEGLLTAAKINSNQLTLSQNVALSSVVLDVIFLVGPLIAPFGDISVVRAFTRLNYDPNRSYTDYTGKGPTTSVTESV